MPKPVEVELITDPEPPRQIDQELEFLARLMDSAFVVPGLGIRFGLDPLLGLIPGLGDAISTFVSLYILSAAVRYEVPRVTMLRMGLNIVLDSALGAVPIVGDMFDVAWKANVKNVDLLRRSIESVGSERRRGRRADWLFLIAIAAVLLLVLIGAAFCSYTLISWAFHALQPARALPPLS